MGPVYDTVAVETDDTLHIVGTDHLGSITLTINTIDNTYQRNRYTPYGTHRGTPGIDATPADFTGQRLDQRTNQSSLHYYNARYYDPIAGRFTQPDTIVPDESDPQHLNRYSYVRNNPVNYTRTHPGIAAWPWWTSTAA